MNNCHFFSVSGITGSVDVDDHQKVLETMMKMMLLLEQRFIAAIPLLKIPLYQRKRIHQRKPIPFGGKEISLNQLKKNKLIQALMLKHQSRLRPWFQMM